MQQKSPNRNFSVVCVGISHQRAPVEVREKLSCVSPGSSDHALIRDHPEIDELIVLSTCNRLEFYAATKEADVVERALVEYIRTTAGSAGEGEPGEFGVQPYAYRDDEAGRHLLRVACGLESVILGEGQILGQVSDAYRSGLEYGHAGPVLQAEFNAAIRAGKRARRETVIGRNAVSVSSIAVNLAEQKAGPLAERAVLVVGLGEIGQLAVQALRHRGIRNVALCNRSVERAEATARPPWKVFSWEELPAAIRWADVIFTATGAATPVVTRSMLEAAGARARTIIDMAVPRDVEDGVDAVEGITLLDIDDLQGIVDETYTLRQGAIPQVEAIIEAELALLEDDLRELSLRGLLVDLRLLAEEIRQEELARTLRYLGETEPEIVERIEGMSRALVNKLLHSPTIQIRHHARSGDGTQIAAAVRTLFGLNGHSS